MFRLALVTFCISYAAVSLPAVAAPAAVNSLGDCRVEFPSFATSEKWVDAVIKYANDKGVTKDVAAELTVRRASLDEQLKWLKRGGFLIDVRLAEANPPASGKALTGISFLGNGVTPANAHAVNTAGWPVEALPPSGYHQSNDDSYMIWLTPSARGYERGCVVGAARDRVLQDSSVIKSSEELMRETITAEHSQRFSDLAALAEQRVARQDVITRLREAEKGRAKAVDDLNKINEQLKAALAEGAAAASAAQVLNLLKGVLSVAASINTVQDQLGASTPEAIKSAQTPEDVYRELKTYKETKDGQITTIRSEVTISVQAVDQAEQKERTNLRDAGVPRTVLP